MSHPLLHYRRVCRSITDGVLWGCALEATSPKLGNVHPSAPFSDLRVDHFVHAAQIVAEVLREGLAAALPAGKLILQATAATRTAIQTNANLGIVLLIVPLAQAIDQAGFQKANPAALCEVLGEVLKKLTGDDGADIFSAIRLAAPGGLGEAPEMDVRTTPAKEPIDILSAMTLAAPRDLIARQYANGFEDLFETVLPVLWDQIDRTQDVLWGIREAQLRLLAHWPDSLIARKSGITTALLVQSQVQQTLASTLSERFDKERQLDQLLRGSSNRLNPGTTADLIAAGLFVLLSTADFPTLHTGSSNRNAL